MLLNKRPRCLRAVSCKRSSLTRSFTSRSSQAALEFIMTYGWAILVVLVAIGALAYFGVLSPDKFLPNKCTLQAGIACLDHRVTASNVQVVLQNSLGDDINNVSVRAGGCGDYPSTGGSTGSATLANSDQATYTIPCTLTGTKYNAQLNVSYAVTRKGLNHISVGQITTQIG